MVNHGHRIEILKSAECRHHRVTLQAVMLAALLLDLNDCMKSMQSPGGHLCVRHNRNSRLEHLEQAGLQDIFAKHDGLTPESINDVIDGPPAMRDSSDMQDWRIRCRCGEADKFAERSLWRHLVDQNFSFENELAFGGYQNLL